MHSAALIRLAEVVDLAISRYPAMWSEGATLAFSGGKDSIALASALAVSGRRPRLRAVDMGYSKNWRTRIEGLAAALDLRVEILVVADLLRDGKADPGIRKELAIRRAFLDGEGAAWTTVTPCTNCYNCKILSLVDAARRGASTILFAHHATDALSSFLKMALMYLDRWDDGNSVFDRERFRELGRRFALGLRLGKRSEFTRLVSLLTERKVQTSEPPVERRGLQGHTYTIGRPLFLVEEATAAAVTAELGLRPESSGCGHSVAASTRTPREIVHYELLPIIAETSAGRIVLQDLLELLAASLHSDGTADIDARGARHLLLGASYKGGPESMADRL